MNTVAEATLLHVVRSIHGHPAFYIKAHAKLYQLNGNPLPHFSLTADIRDQHGESGGCCHDELLAQWPELAPLAAIHLSDSTGAPMHAVENGWYWAGGCRDWCKGAPSDPPNAAHLAVHLRIALPEAESIVARVQAGELNKEYFRRFVDAQRPRWQSEADAAVALIRQLAARSATLPA